MYTEEVIGQQGPKYDAAKRRERGNTFFKELEPNRSLIFYYANYSNPFSNNEENRYVVVGMGRLKSVGAELTWVNQSPAMEQKYGANVWARNFALSLPGPGFSYPLPRVSGPT